MINMMRKHTIPKPKERSSRNLNWDEVISSACCITLLKFVGAMVTRAVGLWDVVLTSSFKSRLTAPHWLVALLIATVRGCVTQSEGIMVMPTLMGLVLSDFPGHTILDVMAEDDIIILAPVQPEQVGTKSVRYVLSTVRGHSSYLVDLITRAAPQARLLSF